MPQTVAMNRTSRVIRGRWGTLAAEIAVFFLKQASACLFALSLLSLIAGTAWLYPDNAWLVRYDFLFLAALALQFILIRTGLETWQEARVIFVFHIVGTAMELFKTSAGSWIYPEESFFRIAGVPLFSGFMYASVGSFIARNWRLLHFRFTRFPPLWAQGLLALGAYVNFFAHHFMPDMRVILFAYSALIYGPCLLHVTVLRKQRTVPLIVVLAMIAVLIWVAENIGTVTATWLYPSQQAGWHMVSFTKVGSWYLLMLISFVLVAALHEGRAKVKGTGFE